MPRTSTLQPQSTGDNTDAPSPPQQSPQQSPRQQASPDLDDPRISAAAHRRAARSDIPNNLDPIDPAEFTTDEATHLLWRAGFGGTPEQTALLAEWGPRQAVDHLVEYSKIDFDPVLADQFDSNIMRPATQEERRTLAAARQRGDEDTLARIRFNRQQAQREDRRQMADIQRWWLGRMIETPRPLEEKLTLFWHGHFATSYRTIEDSFHMFRQNQLFRKHACGNFGELLHQIIRDPAMLAYLDNNNSRRGNPNENLAREIMELFALGEGKYTEQDIREGARALTGFSFNDDEFVFNQANHDNGRKRILGQTGTFDGDDFVRIILGRRDCANFIAGKLYRYFVADTPTGRTDLDNAADRVITLLAAQLRRSRYSLAPVLKSLFLSKHFYHESVRLEQIKSPATLVVGAARSLLTPTRDLATLTDALNLMGQSLFYPPSVAGWTGGRTWINTSSLFVRQNTLCYMLTGKLPTGRDALANAERYDTTPVRSWIETQLGASSTRDIDAVCRTLLHLTLGRVYPHAFTTLRDYFRANNDRITNTTITQALVLITAMPEYQLC